MPILSKHRGGSRTKQTVVCAYVQNKHLKNITSNRNVAKKHPEETKSRFNRYRLFVITKADDLPLRNKGTGYNTACVWDQYVWLLKVESRFNSSTNKTSLAEKNCTAKE